MLYYIIAKILEINLTGRKEEQTYHMTRKVYANLSSFLTFPLQYCGYSWSLLKYILLNLKKSLFILPMNWALRDRWVLWRNDVSFGKLSWMKREMQEQKCHHKTIGFLQFQTFFQTATSFLTPFPEYLDSQKHTAEGRRKRWWRTGITSCFTVSVSAPL